MTNFICGKCTCLFGTCEGNPIFAIATKDTKILQAQSLSDLDKNEINILNQFKKEYDSITIFAALKNQF